jgi:hypothetical protein
MMDGKSTRHNGAGTIMRMHPNITKKVILDAVERRMTTLDNPGFCVACGLEHDGCEPDMRNGTCEGCGEKKVYGADELLLAVSL